MSGDGASRLGAVALNAAASAIVTGARRYERNPATPPLGGSPVQFQELFNEAQNESGRHAIARDDLLARAADPACSAADRALMIEAAADRARLVEIYDAFLLLVERNRNDPVIRGRLAVLAKEAAAAKSAAEPDAESVE